MVLYQQAFVRLRARIPTLSTLIGMSGEGTFSATLTGGVQNISGLLPLLGTQQCEDFVGSALTKGYLCAAATPMSIFGSLGMARAASKTILATLQHEVHFLADMGFEPKGTNLSLIMMHQNNRRQYLIHTRLDDTSTPHLNGRESVTQDHLQQAEYP